MPKGFLTWKFEVIISVAESWVADGHSGNTAWLTEIIREHLLSGMNTESELEVTVKTIKAPEEKTVRRLQGYIIDGE